MYKQLLVNDLGRRDLVLAQTSRGPMRLIGALLLLVLASASVRAADLTPEDRQVLKDATQFRVVASVWALPAPIVDLCAGDGRLAEPGQKWEATDVITDRSLATKRLVWAVVANDYYVVHYERGGRGHSFHVLVATLVNGQSSVPWRGVGPSLKDYAAFLDALRSGTLEDGARYAH